MDYQNALKWFGRAVGFIVVVFSFVAVLNPEVRSAVKDKLSPEFRVVLSTASGDLYSNQQSVQAIKVKTNEGLFVEIYGNVEEGHQPLLARLSLGNARDAYFVFNNQPTNLAIDDVDGDNKLELLVPTFDEDLAARLTVFQYNSESKSFQRMKE